MQQESSAFGYSSKVGSGDTPPSPRKRRKVKLQLLSKARGPGFPKWIPPEKRMRVYDESIPQDKQKWVMFHIVVPDQDTKEQLQAAFEYLHDNRIIDTDFMAVNAVVHSYLDETREKGCIGCITVDPKLYKKLYAKANKVLSHK